MFLADSRSEVGISPLLQDPRITQRRFLLVEQCLIVPLWHVQVLPKPPADSIESQCSTLYLATQVEQVLKVLLVDWQSSKVHVLLPDYMTQSGSPVLAKCLAIWEYRTADDDPLPRWWFETDAGIFADPCQDDGVERKDLKQFAVRWQAAENKT
jgi:hypothetical protein